VLALDPARILPAHGPVIDDPCRLIRAYLEHRRQREAQIVEALGNGVGDPDAIVARVYAGLDEHRREWARETVMAHLLKLKHEGRAVRRAARWALRDREG